MAREARGWNLVTCCHVWHRKQYTGRYPVKIRVCLSQRQPGGTSQVNKEMVYPI